MVIVIGGCIVPRYYNIVIPPHRRAEGTEETVAMEPKGEVVARAVQDGRVSSSDEEKMDVDVEAEKTTANTPEVASGGGGSGLPVYKSTESGRAV